MRKMPQIKISENGWAILIGSLCCCAAREKSVVKWYLSTCLQHKHIDTSSRPFMVFFCKRCLLLWPATVAADAVAHICVVVDAAGVFLCLPLCVVAVANAVVFLCVAVDAAGVFLCVMLMLLLSLPLWLFTTWKVFSSSKYGNIGSKQTHSPSKTLLQKFWISFFSEKRIWEEKNGHRKFQNSLKLINWKYLLPVACF